MTQLGQKIVSIKLILNWAALLYNNSFPNRNTTLKDNKNKN